MKKKVIIMGAAGRDFHNFNVFFRDNEEYEVVAFTATQIPNIEGRKYPAELAGSLYPNGIDIYPESQLDELIKKFNVDLVVFSYSDVAHEYVMHKASQAMVAGASFMLLGPKQTMVESSKPVIAVCAGRTGSGKSQTTRRVVEILRDLGKKVVVVRHPMPYGDLVAQKVQRFATYDDLDYHKCTIEEREEYEPHIDRGAIVYAGVDYEAILRQAEQEADVVIWDGGNNDFPFYKPDLMITVVDPHRPGHEIAYHPGEVNVRMADVVVINKEDTANFEDIEEVRENVRHVNPQAIFIDAASPLFVEDISQIANKRVVVVEDGPTLTHGGMSYGAGYIAAIKYGAAEIVSPKPYAVGTIAETYAKYGQVEEVLPAMGYSERQIKDLEETLNRVPADVIVSGTPINISRLVKVNKPIVRVMYELEEIGKPTLKDVIMEKMRW
ncbi:MAG TPA: cyclic 2,3-diphosphoglycerate synthase [Coprothermobacter proteolyticus]|uniref:CobW/HypB/UreG nucleotide-binding domain-containing protein n=1 Tax=Coprothermobacter proteolyticus (strain ATCC 35245 / DSM 5265 / OCM 4 / BT) TaxID=309798 RepID=B5Y9F3_COPPD|nr:cyclic 2,3-diphosphoglycerate synthase [Coprothermobacter proteolyticus]MBP8983457.1 GTPase [Coprothermobacter sp.]ACI17183.1 GTPase [Coprothermobacter proteolyticus DSM 5265]NLT83421.1 GTPase [Coprothermobacter proteolyticus]HOA64959.1 cyclic 2,3-diphosphoglycerate synthase [Coprothermobacter proteolyticus]HPZ44836.1 cyclic 2,3-diphosphoglycerate synthase [Coprothermobacter proteolyticus]